MTLIQPQMKGIQVGMARFADVYAAPILLPRLVSKPNL
jgi:hypothetical protein